MKIKMTALEGEPAWRLEVSLSSAELREQYSANFRHGGMFLSLAENLKMFTRLEIVLVHGESAAKLKLTGEVVHIVPPHPPVPAGVSIQFINFNDAARRNLEALVGAPEQEQTPANEMPRAEAEETLASDATINELTDDADGKSIQDLIHKLSPEERQRLAATGNRKQRLMLLRLAGVEIVSSLMKNPELSEFELKEILKHPKLPHTIIEEIAGHEDWMKSDLVRLGLFLNPQTPVTIARKYLPYIKTRELVLIQQKKLVKGELKKMVDQLVATRLKQGPKPQWNK